MDEIDPAARTLEVLERDECLALLRTVRHARVAYCTRGVPHIEVVNFVLDGPDAVIRMAVGNRSAAVARGGWFALSADRIDDAAGTGWDVTVAGPVEWVAETAETVRLAALLRASAPGDHPYLARITLVRVTGRRLSSRSPLPSEAGSQA